MLNIVRSILRILALALALALCASDRAAAQSTMAIDFEDAFSPEFMKRDVPTFKSILLLDDDQTSIIDALIHDYNEQFEQALRGVREDVRAAQAAMGVEDPEIDQQREALRGEIATMFEEMQRELANLPVGADAGEVRVKYEGHMKELQARLQQLQTSPMRGEQLAKLFDDASLRMERWRSERKAIREKFAAEVNAVLRLEQQGRWPALERRLLRERTLGRGLLQGEGVDLFLVARDVKLDEAQRQSLATALTDYEMALDAGLRTRNETIENSEREIFKSVQRSDVDTLSALIERITQARVSVRNVNDDFAARLASQAGESGWAAGAIMEAYRQRGYPLVFRDTQALRLIKAAQELPGITPEQVQGLASLRSAYESELGPMNERVLAAVREHEPAQVALRETRRLLPPVPEQEAAERDRPVDGMRQAFNERAEMGKRYDAQLQAVLGEELYERLPRNQGGVPAAREP